MKGLSKIQVDRLSKRLALSYSTAGTSLPHSSSVSAGTAGTNDGEAPATRFHFSFALSIDGRHVRIKFGSQGVTQHFGETDPYTQFTASTSATMEGQTMTGTGSPLLLSRLIN